MRKLLANYSQAYAHTSQYGLGESGTDAQAVNEIVQAVAEYDHPGHWRHCVQIFQAVTVTVALLVQLLYALL
jgi:hypothetical protein